MLIRDTLPDIAAISTCTRLTDWDGLNVRNEETHVSIPPKLTYYFICHPIMCKHVSDVSYFMLRQPVDSEFSARSRDNVRSQLRA